MRRVLVGTISAVLFLALGGTAHAAAVLESQSMTLHKTGEVTKERPADETRRPMSAAEGESVPSAGGSVAAASVCSIFSNGFEEFPSPFAVYGAGWSVTHYRRTEGTYGAYCAGMYEPPPGPYAPNMESWLIAGPFDLTDYTSAAITFDVWADIETDYDFLYVGASDDAETFGLDQFTGTTGGAWLTQSVDVSEYCGSPEVWITFVFESDELEEFEGAYIDRVSVKGTTSDAALSPVFRFYNFRNGTHFYTPSVAERDSVKANLSHVYSYDGIAYSTSTLNNPAPLYRFYNKRAGGHFYTASVTEMNKVRKAYWYAFEYEGPTYSVNAGPVPDSIPVFRFYNTRNGTHFYTASADERDMVMRRWPNVYSYEGPAFWVGQAGALPQEEPEAPGLPIPGTLWQPPAALPATGNYVYLKSDPGDYIGQGREYLYTHETASIVVQESNGHLSVNVNGDEWWNGNFQTPQWLDQFVVEYYPGVTRYPFHNPDWGGMDWSGEGRGSNTLGGWYFVDSVEYSDDGVLQAIDLRFEQQSGGTAPPLHGAIHWRADNPTMPPGPITPIPETLWQPSEISLPATGNYVYLKSDPGDYIGRGEQYLYTPENSTIVVTATGNLMSINIGGPGGWNGTFQAMNSITTLQEGYYPNLQRYPFHNPARGGMSWSGGGRGSNTLTGWFAVDSVTYTGGVLTAIDLRFEQHSEGSTPALHGVIHWRAGG